MLRQKCAICGQDIPDGGIGFDCEVCGKTFGPCCQSDEDADCCVECSRQ
jgi:hypothetical protein